MSTVKVGGDESVRVPKLEANGANWVLYKARLTWAADAKGLAGHLDGTSLKPAAPPGAAGSSTTATAGASQTATAPTTRPRSASASGTTMATSGTATATSPDPAMVQYKADLADWNKGEASVKQLIASTIPDSLFMKIRDQPTARDVWKKIAEAFEKKSRMVVIDLRRRLQDTSCEETEDVRAHLTKLMEMREDLAAMGQPPSDDDFYAIIIGSMPNSYESYFSALSATSRATGIILSPDDLMDGLIDEYDRRKHKGGKKKKSGANTNDAALYTSEKKSNKKSIECHNCHKKGHKKADCWAPGGGKEGQGPKGKGKAKENASTAETKQKEKDEAWLAYVPARVDDDMFADLPDLQSVSDSSEESDDRAWISDDDDFSDFSSEGDPHEHDESTSFYGAMLAQEQLEDEVILFDSGASRHMSPYRHLFVTYQRIPERPINAADNHVFKAVGRGDMYITVPNGASTTRVLLRDVLHAPTMGATLVSVSRISAAGKTVSFEKDGCHIKNSDGEAVAHIRPSNGLYRITNRATETAAATTEGGDDEDGARVVTIDEWHRAMGHISHEVAKEMLAKGAVTGVKLDSTSATEKTVCDSCQAAKMTRKPIARERVRPRATEVGAELHSDLWGPAPVQTLGGRRYNGLFLDDHSRYTFTHLQQTKDETFNSYKKVEAFLKTQKGTQVKCLHTDRGGEYLSTEFTDYLAEKGTIRKLTTHDTPEYNGVAERANRTLIEKVRAMLHDSGLPNALWGEALHHAVYLKNRTPTNANSGKTPYEIFWGKKPNVEHLHPWGIKVRVHTPGGSKLSERATVARWVGFDEETDANRIY